jgi:RecB family exonuclease
MHSAKMEPLPSVREDTRQGTVKVAHMSLLCRVLVQQTLRKERAFVECLLEHSANGLAKWLT